MQCDKCYSDNTQRLQVVYENGMSNINTTSNTVGVGYGRGFGLAGARTSTQGTSQSVLSERAAPPSKKSYKWSVIAIVVGTLFTMNEIYVGIIFAGIGAYITFSSYKYNNEVWPSLNEHWLNCWLCNKCGNIYHLP
jgi:hypothetical protein